MCVQFSNKKSNTTKIISERKICKICGLKKIYDILYLKYTKVR